MASDRTARDRELRRSERSTPAAHVALTETRIVGFVDLLGSKLFAESPEFFQKLASTIEDERRVLALWPSRGEYDFRTIWFSDNIGASVSVSKCAATSTRSGEQRAFDLVSWYLAILQARTLQRFGVSSRGGIALGEAHHSDFMIFGKALVDAYVTESKLARVPRLLVHSTAEHLAAGSPVPLAEEEGVICVDYLRAGIPEGASLRELYLRDLDSHTTAGLAAAETEEFENDAEREAAVGKWRWLRDRVFELTREGPSHHVYAT